ncbi:uncharacterized protein LOC62_01G001028 [Vanrija pseudolonga]|uniref:Uncharacterized protein n=1 Tax=Vanrija pseudolonga TaxID=143232 RepID=A0AAF0Y012_9TREE|nr:hypothetical protein LOC62_01G001028 [Vanrija pseudolonga]
MLAQADTGAMPNEPCPNIPDEPTATPDPTAPDDVPAVPAARPYDFPYEVKEVIVKHFDVNTDRATFLSLLRVSEAWWYAATRYLYRRVELTAGGVVRFLRAAYNHDNEYLFPYPFRSERTRLAVSLVRHLSLCDIDLGSVVAMYRACTPGIVLFPAVTSVHLHFSRIRSGTSHRQKVLFRLAPGTFMFNEIDICGWGAHVNEVMHNLPVVSYRSLNVHLALEPWRGLPLWRFTWPTATWDNTSLVNWFQVLTLDDASNPPQTVNGPKTLGLPVGAPHVKSLVTLQGAVDLDQRPNMWHHSGSWLAMVGARTSYPLTVGPWDLNPTSEIQYRLDTPEHEHPPCVVCGAKTELADRNIGHTFTKTS